MRITQLNADEQADQLVGVQGDVPGDDRLLGLIEGDPRRDLERLHRCGAVVERGVELPALLLVEGRRLAAPEEGLGPRHEGRLGVGAGPQRGQRAAGDQDPTDLVQRGNRVHPVPRRRREDGVGAGVGQRHRLAAARQCPHAGDRFDEHGPHAVVGFHRDDLVGPIHQEAGQRAGAGAQVDHRPDGVGQDPVHRGGRRPLAVALVLCGGTAETGGTGRPLLGRERDHTGIGHLADPSHGTA